MAETIHNVRPDLEALPIRLRDGRQSHDLFGLWRAMIRRCHDPKVECFGNYGARGISVCQRWRDSFWNFVSDVGDRPSQSHTLDRTNNDGNYEPSNVRWATREQQGRNTRFNRRITAKGKTQTLEEWADEIGIPKSTLFNRIKRGWSGDEVVGVPVQAKACDHTIFPPGGYAKCIELGLNPETVKSRLRRGWNFNDSITKPATSRYRTTAAQNEKSPN